MNEVPGLSNQLSKSLSKSVSHRFCVAPMLDWSDRHCRFFHRLLTRHARLYTEMVTTGALLHGDVPRHLAFDASEHPLALQLGGCDPAELAACAKLGERWGYDEINLNCGCPSERVQRGAFGACLMAEPALVRDGVRAMCDAVSLPVTVKHRIGIGRDEDYGFVRDFVGTVAEGGARVFVVHARNAWLQGLSPRQNREVPPLRYDVVRRLVADFPDLAFVVNGGIGDFDQIGEHLAYADGVMLGREAYQNPWRLASVDRLLFDAPDPFDDRLQVVAALRDHAAHCIAQGVPLRAITRHTLGLFNGLPGARHWRRVLSDDRRLARQDPALFDEAAAEVSRRFGEQAA
ncbi:MAG TPA: tRNA dihydrouridine(20/20a) synthase DusA [Burkholderiaceae bacterium]|nr:tRNA dihydrouridine(20/20a) synthase DusA [Burkholderiaceae bacterium]